MRGLDSSIRRLSVPSPSNSRASGSASSAAVRPTPDGRATAEVPRRGPLSHPAILLSIAAAILFTAYALGYFPQFGSLLEAAVRSTRSAGSPALDPALYGIAGLTAFLVLFASLRSFDLLLRKLRKRSPLARRPLKPISAFLEETAAAHISVRVARESYHLLKPYYPQVMGIDLRDNLHIDLGLSFEAINLLGSHLLARCDRRAPSCADDRRNVTTVLDLLHKVETATLLPGVRPSETRERSTDPPAVLSDVVPDPGRGAVAAVPSRHTTSAERKAIHAAALRALESRSLGCSDPAMPRRRSSDYQGLRRRATDVKVDPPVFNGPYRRSTDQDQAHKRDGDFSSAGPPALWTDGNHRRNSPSLQPAIPDSDPHLR